MGHLFLNYSHFVDYPLKYIIITGSWLEESVELYAVAKSNEIISILK